MPKVPSVPFNEIILALKNKQNSLFNESGKIMPPTAKVWNEISSNLNHHVHPKYLYTIVLENRKNCLTEFNIISKDNTNSISDQKSIKSNTSSSSEDTFPPDSLQFNITLTRNEWDEIYPIDVLYHCWDPLRPERKHRNYKILNPGIWTQKIAEHFYEQTSLGCAIVFKRAKIFNDKNNAENFLTLTGQCKDCESVLNGFITSEPSAKSRIIIKCKYYGFFKNCSGVSKRQLSGNLRTEMVRKMVNEKFQPSMLRKLNADRKMEYGDKEPANLPSANVLRTAKCQALKASRFHDDQILSVCMMKHIFPYTGILRDIGYDRFFAHYWSNAEMAVYRSFIKSNKFPLVSIDATGSLVQKPLLVSNNRTKHIFLYEVTVYDKKYKEQYSVCHMLSERHDNNSIYHWLGEWIRDGAPIPKTVVCDQSLALIYASVRAFTQYATLQEYLKICFDIIYNRICPEGKIPNCFIRCDVAHVIKIFTTWPPLKNAHKRVKGFYMRVLAQILLSTELEDLQILLQATFDVIYSETEGNDIRSNNITLCEKSKLFLKKRISNGVPEIIDEVIINFENINDGGIKSKLGDVSFEENLNETSEKDNLNQKNENLNNLIFSFYDLAKHYAVRSQQNVALEEGDHDNLHHIPSLAKYIIDQFKYYPLWSSIMVKSFGYGEKTVSSASSESQWNDLKTRVLAHKNLPLRLEDFLKTHISSIEGSMKLIAAKDLSTRISQSNKPHSAANTSNLHENPKLNLENINVQSLCKKDTDNFELENWRNLAAQEQKKKSIYLTPDPTFSILNINSKSKAKIIGLLKNGNISKLQAVKIKNKAYILSNTCSFDSIVQILSVCYADSQVYKQWIMDLGLVSIYPLWNLVKTLVRDGTTVQSYRKRAQFMIDNFSSEILSGQLIELLSVESTAEEMLKKIINDFPSAMEIIKCESCTFVQTRTKHSISLEVPNDIQRLNDMLNTMLDPDSLKVYSCPAQNCRSYTTITFNIKNPHIFIDLIPNYDFKTLHSSDIETYIKIPLFKIPTVIKLQRNQYHLRGCVIFTVGENPELSTIGHYVAVCRRNNNIWEMYDDLKTKSIICNPKIEANIHLLVYSK